MAVSAAAVILLSIIFLEVNGAKSFVFKFISGANFFRSRQSTLSESEASLLRAMITDLTLENATLRENAGLPPAAGMIPAKIILGGGYLFSDALFVDMGSDSGIRAGDNAFSPERIYVGKITETGRNWSKIIPMGALGEKLALRFGPNKEISLEAIGLGRGELIAELPRDAEISPGETVWLGENPDHAAGLISEIKKIEGREIQNIIIKSPLPFGSLMNILILKKQ